MEAYHRLVTRRADYFIDADGCMFKYILDYLRRNQLLLPEGFKEFNLLLAEAEFYQIQPLIDDILELKSKHSTQQSVPRQTVLLCGGNSGHVYHAYFQTRGTFHIITGKSTTATFAIYKKILEQQGHSLIHGPNDIDKVNFYIWLANMYTWGVLNDRGEQVKSDVDCVRYEIWGK